MYSIHNDVFFVFFNHLIKSVALFLNHKMYVALCHKENANIVGDIIRFVNVWPLWSDLLMGLTSQGSVMYEEAMPWSRSAVKTWKPQAFLHCKVAQCGTDSDLWPHSVWHRHFSMPFLELISPNGKKPLRTSDSSIPHVRKSKKPGGLENGVNGASPRSGPDVPRRLFSWLHLSENAIKIEIKGRCEYQKESTTGTTLLLKSPSTDCTGSGRPVRGFYREIWA